MLTGLDADPDINLSLHGSFMRSAPRAPFTLTANRPSRRYALALLLSGMRLLALIVAVHCTGFIHAAHDFVDALAGAAHVDEDCSSGDDPSHDCPPGCPSCHGASGFLRALPPTERDTAVEVLSPPADGARPWFVELGAPRQTHRSAVYRPPRRTSLSS